MIFHRELERRQELQVLQLAGLAPWLAEQHLDAALESLGPIPGGARNQAEIVGALHAVEVAACATHRRMVSERKSRELDQRKTTKRRRTVRRLMFGFGAATIVVANGTVLAAMPVIAPASLALVGGAAGAPREPH